MKISIHFEKKRIMFGLLLIIALVGTYFAKADLTLNKTEGFISALYSELNIKELIKIAAEKFSALGQTMPLFFFPQFPQRLMYVAGEISVVSEELVALNEKLSKFTEACDCRLAESQCIQGAQTEIMGTGITCKPGPIKVFGEVCPISIPAEELETSADPEKLEEAEGLSVKEIQKQIKNTDDELSFLQKLLRAEMESGLEKQLLTLRPDDAQILRDNLNKLLELGPKLAEPAGKNLSLPEQCLVEKCSPNCEAEAAFSPQACFNPGEQKPMEIRLAVDAGFADLLLGKVGIKNIKLNLPEEIQTPGLPVLPALTIPVPNITMTCPTEQKSITFHSPTPALPKAPTLKLSCPALSGNQSYQCSVSSDEGNKSFVNVEWYFQTFSWLSEKCQELPGMKDSQGIPIEKELQKCFDQETIHQTIVQECDAFWSRYSNWGSYSAPLICKLIGKPCLEKAKSKERECKNIFSQEGESAPSSCNLDTKCSIWPQSCGGTEACYATEDSVKKVIATLEQKCEQLKQSGRETIPEPCKFLPLFTGKFPEPEALNYSGAEKTCPAQKMGDFPLPIPGCTSPLPTVPKIPLSKYSVIIPDIRLPSFNFPPFFRAKLPNIIFEDLILPDIDLCNLDNCQNMFPYLSFAAPTLKIPEIKLSAAIDFPGARQTEVKIAPIQFRPLQFQMPQPFNLNNLMTAELDMPKIPLPQPKLNISPSFNFELLNLLLGLFKIPTGGCYSPDINFNPLNIAPPDYIFSWPAFPDACSGGTFSGGLNLTKVDPSGEEIIWTSDVSGKKVPLGKAMKKICDSCGDTRKFCREAKDNMQEFKDKTVKIQNQVNAEFQSEIQDKLNDLAKYAQQEIESEIREQLDEISQKISEKMNEHLRAYAPEAYVPIPLEEIPMPGVLPVERQLPCGKIPPLFIPMDENIVVEPISLAELWERETGKPLNQPCAKDTDCPTGARCYKKLSSGKKVKECFAIGEPFPTKITIPWPDELKKIDVGMGSRTACTKNTDCTEKEEVCYEGAGSGTTCSQNADCPKKEEVCYENKKCLKKGKCLKPLTYDLPTIPLSELSYSQDKPKTRTVKLAKGKKITITQAGKIITIRLPGLQRAIPSVNFNLLFKPVSCQSKPPKGDNPCPTGEIQSNLEEIKRIRDETQQASQKIIDILK